MPSAVLGGHPAGEDAGRAGREEERGIVVDPATHRAHIEAAGAELLQRRLSIHLDEMVGLLQLPRTERSQIAARCASSSRTGTGTLTSTLQTSARIVSE